MWWLLYRRQYKVLFPVPFFGLSPFFLSLCMGLLGHSFELVPVLLLLPVLRSHTVRLIVIEHVRDVGLFVVKTRLLQLPCQLKRLKTLIHCLWRRRRLHKWEWRGLFFKFSLLNSFSPRLEGVGKLVDGRFVNWVTSIVFDCNSFFVFNLLYSRCIKIVSFLE